MNIKMVICVVCQKEVAKASTLSLKELSGRDGRACRSHDEVIMLAEARRQLGIAENRPPTNMVKEKGWTILENVRFHGPFTPRIVEFMRTNESDIYGDEVIWRAKMRGIKTGQKDAEWLEANQHLIPIGARGKYLVFPRTVILHPGVGRKIPCLFLNGERWKFCFDTLNRRWGQNACFVNR